MIPPTVNVDPLPGGRMFTNRMPRYEILSADAMAQLDAGWRRLVTEIGVEFMSERALELFRAAGQRVEENTVFLDPEFVLEQVALAPREFDLRARNPERSIHIGGDSMAFGAVYGPPFVREGETRRDGTMEDYRNFARLSQSFSVLDSAGGVVCEPNDAPLDSRHLDMTYALMTLTDKVFMGNVVSGENARDVIAMSEILFGGREAIEADADVDQPHQLQLPPALGRPDARRALRVRRRRAAGRPHPVHPHGRDVAGHHPGRARPADGRGALGHRPGPADPPGLPGRLRLVPLEHRHAVRLTDVRHAGVGHRAPVHRADRAPLRAAVPHRRRADLLAGPRRAGRLRGADDPPADLPRRHELGDAHRRLARGRPRRGFEKFVIDCQIVEMLQHEFTPLEIDEGSLGFDAHQEVGHGGHFLGSMHTMERFRTCFYRPFLNSSDNYERWMRNGAQDTATRAAAIWRKRLEEYEQPPLDEAVRAELEEFVVRRRRELGD